MATVERSFLKGLIFKTLMLGLLGTVIAFFVYGGLFALSISTGTSVIALNLLFVQWITGKMIDGAREGNPNATAWTMLLVLKMTALFGIVWVLIAELGLDAIGFVIGFSTFLPAIVWQVVVTDDEDSSSTLEE